MLCLVCQVIQILTGQREITAIAVLPVRPKCGFSEKAARFYLLSTSLKIKSLMFHGSNKAIDKNTTL